MEILKYVSEIRFTSPVFMIVPVTLVLILFYGWRKKTPIPHAAIKFGLIRRKRSFHPLFWSMKKLPHIAALCLIVATGGPVHEQYETRSLEITPYIVIADVSESTVAFSPRGVPALNIEDSMFNVTRTSLTKFVEWKKETSEFFLILYSDTPYAARYFAGGEEAEAQILEFLEKLPKEIQRQKPSRKFYLKGTHTAFALKAAARYYRALPKEYRQSTFVLVTDLEDSELTSIAKELDLLVESGLEKKIYVLAVTSVDRKAEENIFLLNHAILHSDQVRILQAHDGATLDEALHVIGESENSPVDVTYATLKLRSLRHVFILIAIACALFFVAFEELYFRKIP